MPSLNLSDVTLPGVVRELPSKSLWLSAWTSTRTWCAGFWENITGQNPDLAVRLGSPFSVRRRTSMIRTCQGKTHISSDLSEGFPARLQSLGRRFARICQIGSVEDWANASA